jgi:hypothetical protein
MSKTIGLVLVLLATAGCHGGSQPPAQAAALVPAASPLTRLTVEEVAKRMPSFEGARVLDPPSNRGGADFVVQTSACLPPGSRVEAGLARAGWTVLSSEAVGDRTSIEAAAASYLLSATAQTGVDPRCDRKKGELLVELVLRKHR